jgi:microcin C transport system permease protein
MRDYFLRRFLLIPPTLLGITLIVFLITRVVPGGPIERALMEARMGDAGGAQTNQIGSGAISEEQMRSSRPTMASISRPSRPTCSG